VSPSLGGIAPEISSYRPRSPNFLLIEKYGTRCFRTISSPCTINFPECFLAAYVVKTDPVCLRASGQPCKRCPQRKSIWNIPTLGNGSLTCGAGQSVSGRHFDQTYRPRSTGTSTRLVVHPPTAACRPPHLFPDFTPFPPNRHLLDYTVLLYSPYRPPSPQHVRRLMEGSKKGEGDENESPPLQIDPKWCVRCATLLVSLTAKRT